MLDRTSQLNRFLSNITTMVLLLAAVVFFHHCSLASLLASPTLQESCCATAASVEHGGSRAPVSSTMECCHSARVLLPGTLKIAPSGDSFSLLTPPASLRAVEWRSDLADASEALFPVPPDVWSFTQEVLQKSVGTHAPPIAG